MSKKYLVPVSWTVHGSVVVEADNPSDAKDQAFACDLDLVENVDYSQGSFVVDFEMIEEVQKMSKKYNHDLPSWRSYTGKSDVYHEDGGGNDEYYVAFCAGCNERTEHDACTGECVSC